MGTNCAASLADLFLYSNANEFLDNMWSRSGHRRLARSFNLCCRNIDDLIVFNKKEFLDYLKEINLSQLTAEKANKSDHLEDYLDLKFIIDSGGKLSTGLYDKHNDFDFHIVNYFPGLEPSPLNPCEIQRQCHAHQFQSLFMSHQDVEEKAIKKSSLIGTINEQRR